MPRYVYRCPNCDDEIEDIRSSSDYQGHRIPCAKCFGVMNRQFGGVQINTNKAKKQAWGDRTSREIDQLNYAPHLEPVGKNEVDEWQRNVERNKRHREEKLTAAFRRDAEESLQTVMRSGGNASRGT